MATQQQIDDLVDAMEQLLDDMGQEGLSVSMHAKALARIAFQPFMQEYLHDIVMPLKEAERIRDGGWE